MKLLQRKNLLKYVWILLKIPWFFQPSNNNSNFNNNNNNCNNFKISCQNDLNYSWGARYIQLLFPAWTLLAILPPGPSHSYQAGRLACASLGLVSRRFWAVIRRRPGEVVLASLPRSISSSRPHQTVSLSAPWHLCASSALVTGESPKKKGERIWRSARINYEKESVDARDGWQSIRTCPTHMRTSAHICLLCACSDSSYPSWCRTDDKVFYSTWSIEQNLRYAMNNWRVFKNYDYYYYYYGYSIF